MIELAQVEFSLPFALLPLLHARLAELKAGELDERFNAEGASLRFALPADSLPALRKLLADATRGRSELRILD